MNVEILTGQTMIDLCKSQLYYNYPNQLRRLIGKFSTVWVGGVDVGGTVQDTNGKFWDWYPTEEVLYSVWKKIEVRPAE